MGDVSFLEKKTGEFIQELEAKDGPPIYTLSIEAARSVLDTLQAQPVKKMAAHIQDVTLPCGPKGEVSIRIVRPPNTDEALPVAMYFHGGGWILGNKDTHDRLVREIACGADVAVVFVNFTPSPEAKYPTAIEEAYEATKYIYAHGKKWNLDCSRFAVVGDSVGGNMAIAVTLLAKERKGSKIDYQVLFYPVTDANFNTPSYQKYAEGPWLTKAAMEWFWNAYAPDAESRKKPTACPLQASLKQLEHLPPALIITDENDVLRDEGEAYAHKLMRAGVEVTSVRYLGTIHDFVMLNPLCDTPAARGAISFATANLRRIFQKQKGAKHKAA